MSTKLDITVDRTIEALDRIQRFIVKYGHDLSKEQLDQILNKLKELENNIL